MVEEKKIGIVILCTNAYFVLGVRFVKRFVQFYKGNREIKFFLFSDCNPKDYFPDGIDYEYIHTVNHSWVEGTNLKFKSILQLEGRDDISHIFYFDADTNISREFTEEWFIGDMVAGQHYDDEGRMKDNKPYERHPRSKAYIPKDTKLPQVYLYGAFWGGMKEKILEFCKIMIEWQKADRSWGYEPGVNDESFSNCYFHYNPPTKIVRTQDFKFSVSDKGGIGDPRHTNLDVEKIKEDLLLHKDDLINIAHGKVFSEKIK